MQGKWRQYFGIIIFLCVSDVPTVEASLRGVWRLETAYTGARAKMLPSLSELQKRTLTGVEPLDFLSHNVRLSSRNRDFLESLFKRRQAGSLEVPGNVHGLMNYQMALRDGLQSESQILTMEQRARLALLMCAAGDWLMEVGAFVSPKAVPQMEHTDKVLELLQAYPINGMHFPVLVPNMKGLELALKAGASSVSVVASASEAFNQGNLQCSRARTMEEIHAILQKASGIQTTQFPSLPVRAYISMAFKGVRGGYLPVYEVLYMAEALLKKGAWQVSLADTMGTAQPEDVTRIFMDLRRAGFPMSQLAFHPHDTYGMALENTHAAVMQGVFNIDTSWNGLGGCPYARKKLGGRAAGNMSTQQLLAYAQVMGLPMGYEDTEAIQLLSNHLARLVPTYLLSGERYVPHN